MAKIIFKISGIYASVQDTGRVGYAHMGVPLAGPMDNISFDLANHLSRNKRGAACLEIYNGGVALLFTAACQISLCGADAEISISGKPSPSQSIISIRKGEVLNISTFKKGQWLYLAINGKLKSEKVMDSQSFFKGITSQEKFNKDDRLPYKCSKHTIQNTHSRLGIPAHLAEKTIEVFPGPDYERLPENSKKRLLNNNFTISPVQNRMGIHIEETLPNHLKEILSCPVYPGTVQLTPSGKMIVLMRDAQVTGGYPRILQLTEYAVAVLAQKRPGDNIRFSLLLENKT